jgi:hypothetical protein
MMAAHDRLLWQIEGLESGAAAGTDCHASGLTTRAMIDVKRTKATPREQHEVPGTGKFKGENEVRNELHDVSLLIGKMKWRMLFPRCAGRGV